jgi:STE24 endopeptidase
MKLSTPALRIKKRTMSIILLLLLFLIWMAWSPEEAVRAVVAPEVGLPLFAGGYALLALALGMWSRRLARRVTLGNIYRSLERFNRVMVGARWFVPVWFAVGVFELGWGQAVQTLLLPIARWPVQLPGVLVGLTPGLLAWMVLWWSQFPADRALREQSLLNQLDNDLPVFSPPGFRGYFESKVRIQLLFTLVPILMILLLRDVAALGITGLGQTMLGREWGVPSSISNTVESVISLGSAGLVFVFAPALLRRVLHTQPLPASSLRRQLEAMCERAGMRCREILLWRTHNNMGNAAVMGIVPQVRYVMLSDLLLETMTDTQIEAVFAHELGHVRHRHMIWYVVFFATMSVGLFAMGGVLDREVHVPAKWNQFFELGVILIYGGLFWLGFGYLSRWFERQADVYAARTMERADDRSPVGPYGAAVFASALERVAVVNNISISSPNWTHGSIARRMGYIHRIGQDPALTARFDRSIRRVYLGLLLVLAGCGIGAVAVMGRPDPVVNAPAMPRSEASPGGGAAGLFPPSPG